MTLNFKISELLHSDIANMYHINNTTSNPVHLDNMLNLIFYVLQPLRDIVKCPVIITGGYRSQALWQKLHDLGRNPAKNSQHLTGQAADIDVPQKYLHEVFKIIEEQLPYDQLLYEYDLQGHRWIHVSYNHGKNRKQAIDNYKAY
ncbi:MAG: DUF882 domain-containing protein [Clostridia bacterium]|nr:DUF882 domain-containing protein [Clostridia bacterium]